MLKWTDRIPLAHLVPIALLLAVMPAILPPFPEPHLVEKLRMLAAGTLSKPLDIFDLLLHGVPITLLAIRLVRIGMGKSTS